MLINDNKQSQNGARHASTTNIRKQFTKSRLSQPQDTVRTTSGLWPHKRYISMGGLYAVAFVHTKAWHFFFLFIP